MKLRFFGTVTMFAVLGIMGLFATEANSQSSNSVVVESKGGKLPKTGKVNGSIFPIKYNGEDLREFTLSQPLPAISLVLTDSADVNSANVKTLELSEKAVEILHRNWLVRLNYLYIKEINEFSKDIDYQKEDVKILQSVHDTSNELLNTPINSDKDARNFSKDGTHKLLIYLRDASYTVIDEIKKIKNQK